MSSRYVKRKVPLIVVVLVAHDVWRGLTKPQRAALLGRKPVHPRTGAVLRDKHLLRKDGRPTAWGNRVTHWATGQSYEHRTEATA